MSSKVHKPFYKLAKPATLGEAPQYREEDKTLHFVDPLNDIPQLHILQLDVNENPAVDYPSDGIVPVKNSSRAGHRVLDLDDSVSAAYFCKNSTGTYISLYYQGIAELDESTGKLTVLKELIPTQDRSIRRMNDAGVDPAGRFWGAEIDKYAASLGAGNIPEDYKPIGRLWRYDPDGALKEMDDGYVCGNGFTWSHDAKLMFVNDSVGQRTYAYDFDLASGEISNKRCIREYFGSTHEPDGMVADEDGHLWAAIYGGSMILVMDKEGQTVKEVQTTARNMTCPVWGGAGYSTLYATSAYHDGTEDGGHLFKIETGVKGLKKNRFGA